MFRISSLAVLASACLMVAAPVAADQYSLVDVEIEYDGTLLATEAGSATVLAQLEDQARDACSVRAPLYGAKMTDRVCMKDLVSLAVTKIDDEMLTGIYEASDLYIEQPKRPLTLAGLQG